MKALHLLAEAARDNDFLADLPWSVTGQQAVTNVDELGRTYLKPDPDNPGKQILVVVPSPPILPIVNGLHDNYGWQRGGFHAAAGLGWTIYAFKRIDGAEIRVEGSYHERERPDGVKNTAIPFFAPEPPELKGRGWKERYKEWDRKCLAEEW